MQAGTASRVISLFFQILRWWLPSCCQASSECVMGWFPAAIVGLHCTSLMCIGSVNWPQAGLPDFSSGQNRLSRNNQRDLPDQGSNRFPALWLGPYSSI